MPDFPHLADQHGLATVAQLRAAGWSPKAWRHLAATSGQRILPGVLACHRGPLTLEDRVMAAWLWAGVRSVLTGAAALRRHGMATGRDAGRLCFLVPESQRARSSVSIASNVTWYAVDAAAPTIRTVRTHAMPIARVLGGVPTCLVERALVDASRLGDVSKEHARAATIAMLQDRRSTPERLAAILSGLPHNGTRGVRSGLAAYTRGAWSLPEETLAAVVHGAPGLPALVMNPRVLTRGGALIGRPDGYFESVALAVQVHSRAHHDGRDAAGGSQWERTVEADSRYLEAGIAVVGVAPSTLRDHPARFLTRLTRVVRMRRGLPLPDVVVEPG